MLKTASGQIGTIDYANGILTLNAADTKKVDVYYTTGEAKKFNEVASKLLDKKIEGLRIKL